MRRLPLCPPFTSALFVLFQRSRKRQEAIIYFTEPF
jgi:hypothetical protein